MLNRLVRTTALTTTIVATLTTTAFGQVALTFQDGITPLPGGGQYDGTVDNEFRAANPTTSQSENQSMSIDDFDGGFQTQGAMRFENLLVSEGGALPDEVTDGTFEILFAELSLWVTSPTSSDANVSFNRVLGPDLDRRTGSGVWGNDDTWASLGGDLVADQGGFLDGDPIREDGTDASATPDFQVGFPLGDTSQPRDNSVYSTGNDSQDLLTQFLGAGDSQQDAIAKSFYRYDVTDAIFDWYTQSGSMFGENFGWSINIDSGNGWDFLTSEFEFAEFSQAGVVFDGVNGPAPETLRPALTIIYAAGPIGDLDFDGNVDLDDYELLLDNLAIELDGPIATGATGDLDFDRDVDLDDFAAFKAAYEDFNGIGSLALSLAVPEPTAATLLVLAGLVGGVSRRR